MWGQHQRRLEHAGSKQEPLATGGLPPRGGAQPQSPQGAGRTSGRGDHISPPPTGCSGRGGEAPLQRASGGPRWWMAALGSLRPPWRPASGPRPAGSASPGRARPCTRRPDEEPVALGSRCRCLQANKACTLLPTCRDWSPSQSSPFCTPATPPLALPINCNLLKKSELRLPSEVSLQRGATPSLAPLSEANPPGKLGAGVLGRSGAQMLPAPARLPVSPFPPASPSTHLFSFS